MLVGDALQALAFEVLTPDDGSVEPALQARLCGLLARAAGRAGMAGGQAIDLASVGQPLDERALARHAPPQDRRAAARQRADGRGVRQTERRASWQALDATTATRVGLAFQVVDDILDVDARLRPRSARPPARTRDQNKPTYVTVLGLDAARARADELRDAAHAALRLDGSGMPPREQLRELADRDRRSATPERGPITT